MPRTPAARLRFVSTLIIAVTAAAVSLLVAAMLAYPGGNQWDTRSSGNDFWLNYMCDLERTVAINGRVNDVASPLASSAMVLLTFSLAGLYLMLPSLFPSRVTLGTWVRALGLVGAAGALFATLSPADRVPASHTAAIVFATGPSLGAAFLSLLGVARERGVVRATFLLGAATLAVAATDFTLYVRQLFLDPPGSIAVPILERASFLLLLAWIVAVALEVRVHRGAHDVQHASHPSGPSRRVETTRHAAAHYVQR